jgi:hypothetical protein
VDIKIAKAVYFIHSENSIPKINEAVYYRRMGAKNIFSKNPNKIYRVFKIKKWRAFIGI